MNSSIYHFILRSSPKQQFVIVLLTVVSLPFYYVALEIPKKIINKALGSDVGAYPHALRVLGRDIIELEQLQWLLLLCLVFLLAVATQGGLKYLLNVYKGQLGERLLRELRRDLCAQVLRFPLDRFSEVSSDELNAIIAAEVDPLGAFIGDAIAVPALQGGLLLTAIAFIFLQDPFMGLAAIALFPVQGIVIPRMQRKVNALGRQRVLEVRRLSTRLGEAVEALPDIRAGGHGPHELSVLDDILGSILRIRYELYQRKFLVKFLNNFIFQVTPFLFLLIGGYLVIRAELTLGALVAVLAAYKDLPPPAKELLGYYQDQHDARLKYEQIMSRFMAGAIGPEDYVVQPTSWREPVPHGTVEVHGLSVGAADGAPLLDDVTFEIRPGERVAVVAGSRTGQALTQILVGLRDPRRGTVSIGGQRLDALPRTLIGRAIAYVGEQPRFFKGSLADNLRYGFTEPERAPGSSACIAALRTAGLGDDLAHLGLNAIIDVADRSAVEERLLGARRVIHERLTVRDEALIEPFDIERYCHHTSIAKNLFWGEPLEPGFDLDHLSDDPSVVALLRKAGLIRDLTAVGEQAARVLLEGAGMGAWPDAQDGVWPLLHDDEVPGLRAALDRASLRGVDRLPGSHRRLLITVALRLVAGVHGFFPLQPALLERVLMARKALIAKPPPRLDQKLVHFDPARYNGALSLRENLLFGIIIDERPQAVATIETTVLAALRDLDLEDFVVAAALEFDVGINGNTLSAGQRQRLGIARALLTDTGALVICRASSELEPDVERWIVENLTGSDSQRTLIWALNRPHMARHFDRVLVFDGPRLVEAGTYEALHRPGTHLWTLVGND